MNGLSDSLGETGISSSILSPERAAMIGGGFAGSFAPLAGDFGVCGSHGLRTSASLASTAGFAGGVHDLRRGGSSDGFSGDAACSYLASSSLFAKIFLPDEVLRPGICAGPPSASAIRSIGIWFVLGVADAPDER